MTEGKEWSVIPWFGCIQNFLCSWRFHYYPDGIFQAKGVKKFLFKGVLLGEVFLCSNIKPVYSLIWYCISLTLLLTYRSTVTCGKVWNGVVLHILGTAPTRPHKSCSSKPSLSRFWAFGSSHTPFLYFFLNTLLVALSHKRNALSAVALQIWVLYYSSADTCHLL